MSYFIMNSTIQNLAFIKKKNYYRDIHFIETNQDTK